MECEPESRFCVYAYFRPDTGEPFYIGKGSRRRSRVHLSCSHNGAVTRIIAKLRRNGFEPEVRLLFFGNENQCKNEEKRLIAILGRRDLGTGPLVNFTAGGDGTLDRIVAEAERQKLRAAAEQQWRDSSSREKKIAGIIRSWRDSLIRESRLQGAKKAGVTIRARIAADPAARVRLSKQIKKAWADPKYRERGREAMRQLMADPAIRARLANTIRQKYIDDPSYKTRVSQTLQSRYKNESFRNRMLVIARNPLRREKIAAKARLRKHSESTKETLSELQRKLTEENLQFARELFLADHSIAAIAKRLNVSFTLAYRAIYGLRRAYARGVPSRDLVSDAIRRHREAAAMASRKLSSPDVQAMFELRRAGMAFATIGRQFGVSKKTVMNIVGRKIYKECGTYYSAEQVSSHSPRLKASRKKILSKDER